MQGITDRDIAYDMLFGSKAAAKLYCDAALESATPSCVRTFAELQRRSQEFQRRIWEFLHQRQEYRVTEAHPEEIRGVRERMERLRDDHLQGQNAFGNREPVTPGAFARQTGGGYRETAWNPVGPATGGFNAGGFGSQGGYGTTGGYGAQGGYGTTTNYGNQSGFGTPAGQGSQPSGRWESTQRY